MQVLTAIPQRHCRLIFLHDRVPSESIREAIRLHAPVFCKWLQSVSPSLDLRAANPHLLDWARLFGFLVEVPDVAEVHLGGELHPVQISRQQQMLKGVEMVTEGATWSLTEVRARLHADRGARTLACWPFMCSERR